jgi:hypothetical protein
VVDTVKPTDVGVGGGVVGVGVGVGGGTQPNSDPIKISVVLSL